MDFYDVLDKVQELLIQRGRPIKRSAPRWSPALRGISRSISVMGCSSTSATPWRTKMTPSGPCGPGWGWSRPWANSIPA